jgi:ABC-type branched-subunit amino acid transport system substrate-binding protein
VVVVVGYPDDGVQLFKDYYADFGDDTDVLVTDGLQDTDLPGDVGNDLSNVQGTAPSAAGPGRDFFVQQFQNEFGSEPGVFTSQAYDASAILILANLLAGENSGPAIRDNIRAVANPGGTEYGPESLADAVSAAASGENVNYQGASSVVSLDDNGDITAATYQVFGFADDGIETIRTIPFEASGAAPEPEPAGDGSDSGRTVKLGVLQPETGNLGNLGVAIRDAARLPAIQLEGEVDFEFDVQTADTQSTASAGIDAANSLVSAGYPGVTGAASSETSIQVANNVFVPNEVVGVSPASTSPAITDLDDDDYFFRTPPSDALQGQVLAQVAYDDLEARTAATLYLNNSYGQALAGAFADAFEERGDDATVEYEVAYDEGQQSYTSKVQQAMGQ